jgi:MoxR-like ATPase
LKHRGYVIPEDVRAVIYDVLRHRIGLTYEAEAENVTTEDLISQIINEGRGSIELWSFLTSNSSTHGY